MTYTNNMDNNNNMNNTPHKRPASSSQNASARRSVNTASDGVRKRTSSGVSYTRVEEDASKRVRSSANTSAIKTRAENTAAQTHTSKRTRTSDRPYTTHAAAAVRGGDRLQSKDTQKRTAHTASARSSRMHSTDVCSSSVRTSTTRSSSVRANAPRTSSARGVALRQSSVRTNGTRKGAFSKKILAIVSVALVAMLAVGGTIAWLTSTTDSLTNTFTPASVTTKVSESTSGSVKSDVKIQNTGSIDAFIRVAIQINWADEDGNICGSVAAPVEGSDYTVTYNTSPDSSGNKWFKGSDGYWYWSGKVAPEEYTGILITSLEAVSGKAPEGYSLDVRVIGSGIQAAGTGEGGEGHPQAKAAVETAWPAVVRSSDGNSISKAN